MVSRVPRIRDIHAEAQRIARRRREHAAAPPHAVAHYRRGTTLRFARFRAAGLGAFAAFVAVLGPGMLAGLSDDDPAGITAAGSLVGVPAWISAPIAGVLISLVVVLGSFHRVEAILLLVSSTLALYIVDGIVAGPDWSLVWRNSLVPHLPVDQRG